MIKKKVLFGLLFSGFIFLSFGNLTFSQTVSSNWEDAKGCMAFSRTVNTFLKENPDVKEVDYEDIIFEVPVDEGLSNDESDTYFSYYDEKDRIITVVKGAKNADSSAINFDLAKKIAKLSVPKNFSKLETRFLDNDYLIITTELQGKEKETLVLIYSIKKDKLTPVHYFKQTGKSVLVHLQGKKLYVISVAPLSKTDAQNFVKKDGDLGTIFPKLESGVKYGEIVTENKVSRCQDYKYYFPKNGRMPEFWSFTVMDLSNTQFPKQHLFFLGRFLQFKFANDFLYATSESEDGSTAIEKFGLAPKLNYQKINQLSGAVLDNGIIVNGVDSAYITKLSSGKMKSYRFTSFDERFGKLEELELANGNDEYSLVQQLGGNIVVLGNDYPRILGEWKNGKVNKKNVVLSGNGNFYLHSDSPLKFLVIQTEGKVKLSFYEEKNGSLDKIKTYYYSGFTSLLGEPSWNKKNSTLLLPIKVSSFDGLRALNCSNPNMLKEIGARSYKDASFKAVGQLKYFAYAITENFIDIFLSNKSTSMKLLRLK